MTEVPRLTINTFLALLIKAKKENKKLGNGKLLIALIAAISSDTEDKIKAHFTQHTGKEGDKIIDTISKRLVINKTQYQSYGIRPTDFEKLCKAPRPSSAAYTVYLEKMHRLCKIFFEIEKYDALVYSLLALLRNDNQISTIFYHNQHIKKEELFGTFAHPKRICLEALLLGLWYHVQMIPAAVDAETLELFTLPYRLPFQVFLLGDENEYIFRQKYSVLGELLDPNIPVSLKKCLQENAKHPFAVKEIQSSQGLFTTLSAQKYPVQIFDTQNGTQTSAEALLKDTTGNLFLYGTGGVGKTTTLLHQIYQSEEDNCQTVCFFFSLNQYRKELHDLVTTNISCWLLVHILLKYRYQYEYRTFEACAACEGEAELLRQLIELQKLLSEKPENRKPHYILLLDGMNEIPSSEQDVLAKELAWICEDWLNVRLIVTGRTIPRHDLFNAFKHLEVCGLSEDARNEALSALSDYAQLLQNPKLMEVLKIPLFLNMYLENRNKSGEENPLCTRGEILDAYIMIWEQTAAERSAADYDAHMSRFIVQYVLPFAAKMMLDRDEFAMDRGTLYEAVNKAYKTYLRNEIMYQNYIAPQRIRKAVLQEKRKTVDFVELLLENVCFLTADHQEQKKITFTHQYFRDYFAAKHILNLIEALETAFGKSHTDEKKVLFHDNDLGHVWFDGVTKYEIYELIGEISGDYKNAPDPNEEFEYHETLLDTLLDMCREFDVFRATENVITTMSIARNGIICGADFSNTSLPLYIPCNVKFSLDGAYPSSFQSCKMMSSITPYESKVYCAAYSPDGDTILFGLADGYVFLWDFRNSKFVWEQNLASYMEEELHFESASFSADGRYLTLRSAVSAVVLDAISGTVVRYAAGYWAEHFLDFSELSQNGHFWMVKWHEFTHSYFCLVDLETSQPLSLNYLPQTADVELHAEFSHNSKQILFVTGCNQVELRTPEGVLIQKKTFEFRDDMEEIQSMFFLPDDTGCLICTTIEIILWNLESDETSVVFVHENMKYISDTYFSPDRQYGTVRYQTCDDEECTILLHIPTGTHEILPYIYASQLVFSPDSKYFLAVTDEQILLYDIEQRTCSAIETQDRYDDLTAAFSPDSVHFLLGDTQYTISDEKETLHFREHFNHYKGCDFRGADFFPYDESKEILRHMGAIVDE